MHLTTPTPAKTPKNTKKELKMSEKTNEREMETWHLPVRPIKPPADIVAKLADAERQPTS
jgi:hypothetical protein